MIAVTCTFLAEQGEDPLTLARVLKGTAFCTACGATDHEQQVPAINPVTGDVYGGHLLDADAYLNTWETP